MKIKTILITIAVWLALNVAEASFNRAVAPVFDRVLPDATECVQPTEDLTPQAAPLPYESFDDSG